MYYWLNNTSKQTTSLRMLTKTCSWSVRWGWVKQNLCPIREKKRKRSNKWMTVMICTVGFEGEPVWVGCVGCAVVVGGGMNYYYSDKYWIIRIYMELVRVRPKVCKTRSHNPVIHYLVCFQKIMCVTFGI